MNNNSKTPPQCDGVSTFQEGPSMTRGKYGNRAGNKALALSKSAIDDLERETKTLRSKLAESERLRAQLQVQLDSQSLRVRELSRVSNPIKLSNGSTINDLDYQEAWRSATRVISSVLVGSLTARGMSPFMAKQVSREVRAALTSRKVNEHFATRSGRKPGAQSE